MTEVYVYNGWHCLYVSKKRLAAKMPKLENCLARFRGYRSTGTAGSWPIVELINDAGGAAGFC